MSNRPANPTRLSDLCPEETQWLWRPLLPLAKVTILDGDPGLAKSALTLDLAARVTTGQAMPGDECGRDPGAVVLVGSEDGLADTVVPRSEALEPTSG